MKIATTSPAVGFFNVSLQQVYGLCKQCRRNVTYNAISAGLYRLRRLIFRRQTRYNLIERESVVS